MVTDAREAKMNLRNKPLEQLGFKRLGNNHGLTSKMPLCIHYEHCTLAFDNRGKWFKLGRQHIDGFKHLDINSTELKLRYFLATRKKVLNRLLKLFK